MRGRVSEINQVKGYVSKNDQLQYVRIAVDRFFKVASSFDRFFERAFLIYRFLIGGIEVSEGPCSRWLWDFCHGSDEVMRVVLAFFMFVFLRVVSRRNSIKQI